MEDLSFIDDYNKVKENELSFVDDYNRVKNPSLGTKIGNTINDIGVTTLKSAVGVPEVGLGLADIVTGGRAGKAAEPYFNPKQTKEYLDTLYSPEQQKANLAVRQADGFVPTVKAYAENPSVLFHDIGEQALPILTGGAISRGVQKLAPKASPYLAAGIGEGAITAGQNIEQVRQETPGGLLGTKQILPVLASSAVTGGISGVSGKLANRLGYSDFESNVLAQGAKREATRDISRLENTLASAGFEGLAEELPQSIQEQVAQNYALDKPLTEGVGQAAAQGLLLGSTMGGVTGAVQGPLTRAANKVPETVNEQVRGIQGEGGHGNDDIQTTDGQVPGTNQNLADTIIQDNIGNRSSSVVPEEQANLARNLNEQFAQDNAGVPTPTGAQTATPESASNDARNREAFIQQAQVEPTATEPETIVAPTQSENELQQKQSNLANIIAAKEEAINNAPPETQPILKKQNDILKRFIDTELSPEAQKRVDAIAKTDDAGLPLYDDKTLSYLANNVDKINNAKPEKLDSLLQNLNKREKEKGIVFDEPKAEDTQPIFEQPEVPVEKPVETDEAIATKENLKNQDIFEKPSDILTTNQEQTDEKDANERKDANETRKEKETLLTPTHRLNDGYDTLVKQEEDGSFTTLDGKENYSSDKQAEPLTEEEVKSYQEQPAPQEANSEKAIEDGRRFTHLSSTGEPLQKTDEGFLDINNKLVQDDYATEIKDEKERQEALARVGNENRELRGTSTDTGLAGTGLESDAQKDADTGLGNDVNRVLQKAEPEAKPNLYDSGSDVSELDVDFLSKQDANKATDIANKKQDTVNKIYDSIANKIALDNGVTKPENTPKNIPLHTFASDAVRAKIEEEVNKNEEYNNAVIEQKKQSDYASSIIEAKKKTEPKLDLLNDTTQTTKTPKISQPEAQNLSEDTAGTTTPEAREELVRKPFELETKKGKLTAFTDYQANRLFENKKYAEVTPENFTKEKITEGENEGKFQLVPTESYIQKQKELSANQELNAEQKQKDILSSGEIQPYQQTLLEYGKSKLKPEIANQITNAKQVKSYSQQHIKEIKSALENGLDVPTNVLNEYRGTQWADNALENKSEKSKPFAQSPQNPVIHETNQQDTVAKPQSNILNTTKAAWVKQQAKEQGLKVASPGFKEAKAKIESEFEKELVSLPVEDYLSHPEVVKDKSPESLKLQDYESKRAELGLNKGEKIKELSSDRLITPAEESRVDNSISQNNIIEHTTQRGKVLRGIVRNDLTKSQAQAIDNYTFKKDGGWFIREKHLNELPASTNDVTNTSPVKQEEPQKKNLNVEKLRAIGKSTIEKAQVEQNRDRLSNTSRRAGMAASAIDRALADEAIGNTAIKLADAIERGEVKYLTSIKNKSQLENLDRLVNVSKYTHDKKNNVSYSEQEKQKGRLPTEDDIKYIEYPEASIHESNFLGFREKLKSKRGGVSLAASINGYTINQEQYKKIKSLLGDKEADNALGWYPVEMLKQQNRLKSMGINNQQDLYNAAKEYIQIKQGKKEEDPIKVAERALIGQKVGAEFFDTPKELSLRMADLAGVKEGATVLEPSAGSGNLADAAKSKGASIDTLEISSTLRDVLKAKGHNIVDHDFNTFKTDKKYDSVIMNPPFSNRQDADHIMKAFDYVKPNGKLVAIAGEGVFFGSDKKAVAFRDWLDDNNATVEKLPPNTFNGPNQISKTGANARLIVIDKTSDTQFSKSNTQGTLTKQIFTQSASKVIRNSQQLIDKGILNVYDSVDEAPDGYFDKSKDRGVQAFYDPKEDKIHVIGSNIQEDEIGQVLKHDFYHRAKATDKKLQKALVRYDSDIQNRFKLAARGIGTEIEKRAYQRVIDASTPESSQQEEFEAYMISEYSKNPTSFTGKIKRIIDDLVASIRAALVRNGMDFGFVKSLTPADLAAMSKYGTRYESSKQANTGTENNDIRFSIRDNIRNIVSPRQDATDPQFELNQRIRENHKSIKSKAKQLLKKELSPGGLMPKIAFDLKIKRDSNINAEEFDAENIVAGLDRAIKSTIGKDYSDLDQSTKELIDERLKGEEVELPESIKDRADTMRLYLDRRSARYSQILFEEAQQLQAEGKDEAAAAKVQLLSTIASNVGKYVNRSYRAFDDENWYKKIPAETLNNARDYLANRYREQGSENPVADAQRTINDIIKTDTAYDSFHSFIKESKLGAKDLSILIKRKEIAPEIRELLGEYKDARVNFVKSATKMNRLIFNDDFLKAVKSEGLFSPENQTGFLFDEANRPSDEHTVKIAADSSSVMAPLNGLYTYPEINQAFSDALNKENLEGWYKTMVKVNGLVKYGKTVLSPTTGFRNWMSAYFFTLANAHFDMSHARESWASLRTYLHKSDNKVQYLKKLKQLGVIYDTPYAGEMMDLLADSKFESALMGGDKTALDKTKEKVKDYLDLATKLYQFGDDFSKIIGFENEKRLQMRYYNLTESQAEEEAAKRIRDTYPTYSMVGKVVQRLRRNPLVGTFVSFPAEIIRTTYNILKYAQQDYQHNKELGRRRIAGLAMTTGFTFAAQALAKSMVGMDDDEEEALRDLAPPWSKNSNIVPLGRDKDGQLVYLDLSFLDPYNYFKRPINAILRGQPVDETAYEVGREILTPFFGKDITFGAITEIWQNKKDSGGRVFNPNDSSLNISAAIANHLRKNLQPGAFSNIERLSDAITGYKSSSGRVNTVSEELAGLVGFRASRLNPRVALYYRSYEFQDKLRDASSILNDVARNPNSVSDSEIKSAYERAKQTRSEAFKDMHELVKAAEKSGLSRPAIRSLLKANRVSKANINAILLGKEPNWNPGKTFLKSSINRSNELFDKDVTNELERRRKFVLSQQSRQ